MPDRQPPHNETPEGQTTAPAANVISRRGFLKGAGITAAGTALLDGVQSFREAAAEPNQHVKEYGPAPFPSPVIHAKGPRGLLGTSRAHV